jgi:hemin uptake protein HemP
VRPDEELPLPRVPVPWPSPETADTNARHLRVIASDTLLQGDKVVEIGHNGAVYRLQATRQGKLILTK